MQPVIGGVVAPSADGEPLYRDLVDVGQDSKLVCRNAPTSSLHLGNGGPMDAHQFGHLCLR